MIEIYSVIENKLKSNWPFTQLSKDIKKYWVIPDLSKNNCNWTIVSAKNKMPLSTLEYKNALRHTTRFSNWKWPNKEVHFISDIHADADALIASLILADTIQPVDISKNELSLTAKGKKNHLVIGGDCLDKGPSNLRLLRTLKKLIELKPDTILLAGNHDLRLYLGLKSIAPGNTTASEHFFVRMGKKIIPLLKEIYDQYLAEQQEKVNDLSNREYQMLLFPSKQWQHAFRHATLDTLSSEAYALELKKIHKKWFSFEENCNQYGLTLSMAYKAAKKCYALFMQPEGEFYWFFNQMQLIHVDQSFVFAHAGLDDKAACMLNDSGVESVNNLYKDLLKKDSCQFYYGGIANMFRTKYRSKDLPLTKKGVKLLHKMGIHAVVHGHVNQKQGQQLSLRKGMLHFECDIILDKNSRIKAKLPGNGAGVTIFSPEGKVEGLCIDIPYTKTFQPEITSAL
ncbi:MAG: metallophosphoesterase family protein [Pseudomonadota bacterium]